MLVVVANDLPPAVRGRMKLWFTTPERLYLGNQGLGGENRYGVPDDSLSSRSRGDAVSFLATSAWL